MICETMNMRNRELTPQSLLHDAARNPLMAGAVGFAVGAVAVGTAFYRQHRQDRQLNAMLQTDNTHLSASNNQMGLEIEELERKARTDSLTELGNHRHLEQKFEALVQEGATVGLIIFDLDNFKAANDELGHAEGDRKLRLFASKLKGVRDTDMAVYLGDASEDETIAIRTGGDEFALLVRLPGEHVQKTRRTSDEDRRHPQPESHEMILSKAAKRITTDFETDPDVLDFNAPRLYKPQLGVSANFAIRRPGESLQSLTERADVIKRQERDGNNHDVRQEVHLDQMDVFDASAEA